MDHNLIDELEIRTELLIDACEKLKAENTALKSQQQHLLQEREQLLASQQHMENKVKAVVSRLNSLVEECIA